MRLSFILTFLLFVTFMQAQIYDNDSLTNRLDIERIKQFLTQNDTLKIGYFEQSRRQYNEILRFVKMHPKATISPEVISWCVNLTLLQIDTLLQIVDSTIISSPEYALALNTRNRIQVIETGTIFPDLLLIDTVGDKVHLYNKKRKLTFINFWSSDCSPCRQEMPELKELYGNFTKNGFQIIGVSLDYDKKVWLNAIRQDGQIWDNFCDLSKWRDNKIAKQFFINYIPTNILIDEQGTIIGQDLSMHRLRLEIRSRLN